MLLLDYLLLKRTHMTHRRRNLNSPRKQELHERKRRKVSSSLANMVKDLLRVARIKLVPRTHHAANAVKVGFSCEMVGNTFAEAAAAAKP